MKDKNNIQHLLDSFMSGTTTEQEERQLTDYFNSSTDIPDEWAAYAVLFRGFRNQVQAESQSRHSRRVWLYSTIGAVAASILLLICLGITSNHQNDEGNNLVAQTDTTIVSPQTGGKEVETRPLEEKGSEEITDTVKRVKEILQMSKPPKHYIARQEKKAENHAEQETLDESDWAERIIAEEEQRFATEMMAAMNGSLHTDFQEMAKEIRQRGERMTQQVEIALNNE